VDEEAGQAAAEGPRRTLDGQIHQGQAQRGRRAPCRSRSWAATDASRHDGALLPVLIDKDNTASDVWADTAYRSKANEKHLANNGLRSQIHRKKPKGKPMARRTARANGRKSAVRAAVEHVFARQKGPMGLYIRTIGLARARTKIGMANLVYNMKRIVWLTVQTAPA
jgi:IS5 family transposase